MDKLNEAVRHLELAGVVFPLISIDEFEPKTGKESEVIVVGLFCKEEEAAIDLRDFLEKGVTDTLDIDTSPSCDEEGRYLVFVELKRNPDFWDALTAIVADAARLAGKLDWKVVTYLNAKGFAMDDPELRRYVITDPKKYMTKEEFQEKIKGSVSEFFQDTDVDDVEMQEGRLYVRAGLHTASFMVESVGDCDYTGGFEMNRIPSEVVRLRKLLGNEFSVNYSSGKIYVENLNNGSVLTLSNYE